MAAPTASPAPAVPLDDELDGLLNDLAGLDDDLDTVLDSLRRLATKQHTLSKTQSLVAGLVAGADGTNLLHVIAHLIARLTVADTNPALTSLDPDQAKAVQLHGERTVHWLTDPALTDTAAEIPAAIDGT